MVTTACVKCNTAGFLLFFAEFFQLGNNNLSQWKLSVDLKHIKYCTIVCLLEKLSFYMLMEVHTLMGECILRLFPKNSMLCIMYSAISTGETES